MFDRVIYANRRSYVLAAGVAVVLTILAISLLPSRSDASVSLDARTDRYSVDQTGQALTIHYVGACDGQSANVTAREQSDRVVIAIDQASTGSCIIDSPVSFALTVALDAPLGDRSVIDDSTNSTLLRGERTALDAIAAVQQ